MGDGTCGKEAGSEQPSFCQLSSLTPFLSLFCSIWGGRSSCIWVWERDNLAMTLRCQKTMLPLTPTLRDSAWGIDLHFHVKMHMFLAPHDCTSAGSLSEREGGLEVCCVFLALGHCSGCPRSTVFRQADCSWGQGRECQRFLTANTSQVPGCERGRCTSTSSWECWTEIQHPADRVLRKSCCVFSVLWMTKIMTTICFSVQETWASSFLPAK